MFDSLARKPSGLWSLALLAMAAGLVVVAATSPAVWATDEAVEASTEEAAGAATGEVEPRDAELADLGCDHPIPEGAELVPPEAEEKLGPTECCTYKEWTYYAGPSHTTVVGSRTRFCCKHRTYQSGQVTQYCDWLVTGCPDDPWNCPNGPIDSGSSNNCQS